MKKNDIVTAVIENIGSNCEGIVKVDGIVCFVPFSLIGEKVVFKVLKVKKNIAFCKLLDVLTPSDDRVRPLCPIFTKCGGCQMQHLKVKNQLKFKSNIIKDCFKKIAGLDVLIEPPIKNENEYFYRNKIQLPVRETENGNVIGFFRENSHRIIETDKCYIQEPFSENLINAFKIFIKKSEISCYNELTNKGLLKHIVARNVCGKLLIVVVINGSEFPYKNLLIEILSSYFKEFSLILNENTLNNNVILGEKFTVIYGDGVYYFEELGLKYPVYPQSFIQVNNYIKNKLYSCVLKLLNLDENTTVIDAYSGAGVMTALFSKHCKKAIGIEIVKEAVKCADELKIANNLTDKMFNYCSPCEDILPNIIEKERAESNNISVVLDPPRKGCDNKVLSAILKSMPNKIVYIACSPQSLARDVGILMGSLKWVDGELKKVNVDNYNYKIEKVIPFDMFTHTKHIETVVCLTRVNHNI